MKKVLIVDDDPGIIEALALMLEIEGYEIAGVVTDGNDIDRNLKTDKPNLILLDVLLSGSDGRDIAKRLKTNTKTKDIPIIMLSAHPYVEDSVRQAGANDFIAKPFEMKDLLTKVSKYIN